MIAPHVGEALSLMPAAIQLTNASVPFLLPPSKPKFGWSRFSIKLCHFLGMGPGNPNQHMVVSLPKDSKVDLSTLDVFIMRQKAIFHLSEWVAMSPIPSFIWNLYAHDIPSGINCRLIRTYCNELIWKMSHLESILYLHHMGLHIPR